MSSEVPDGSPEAIVSQNGETIALRFEVGSLLEQKLGPDWQIQFEHLMESEGKVSPHTAEDPTCREDSPTDSFYLVKLDGQQVVQAMPPFWDLYKGTFRDMMQKALPANSEQMRTYEEENARDCLEVYSQLPPPDDAANRSTTKHYRLDAHVDQRYSAILVIRAPHSLTSGRLVISNNPDAVGTDAINKDATFVRHKDGTLICFPLGRQLPHYTEPIQKGDVRMVVSINYPTEGETPEDTARIAQHNHGNGVGEE